MKGSLPLPTVRSEGGVVIGNVYDKYRTRNPVARYLMTGFLSAFRELVTLSGAQRAHEVGCGEGRLALELWHLGLEIRGSDFSREIVSEAREYVVGIGDDRPAPAFEVADIYQLGERHASELLVCCEVLEHLQEPERALASLAPLARPWLLLSVPREPIWRILNLARGRYLSQLGNTPGHLQHWSRAGFLRSVARHASIVSVRSPLPWTLVLAKRIA